MSHKTLSDKNIPEKLRQKNLIFHDFSETNIKTSSQ